MQVREHMRMGLERCFVTFRGTAALHRKQARLEQTHDPMRRYPSRRIAPIVCLLLAALCAWLSLHSMTVAADETQDSSVGISEVTLHGDMDCFRIETPTATYVYGKRGAGFASVIDQHGHDWISYSLAPKSHGQYRGLPKCGQPTKYFHCGYGYGQYPTDNPFTSRVVIEEDDHVRIESKTRDGKSACRWDFYPDHATFTLLKIALPTYWFLYEGTPGGELDPEEDFVIRPGGEKTTLDEPWSEVVPWVCFGAQESPAGFLCINHQEPEPGQTDSYVSWPFEPEEDDTYQEMTVFGFGRKGYKELIEHIPDLKQLPARFTIAFIERAEHDLAKEADAKFREFFSEQ